MIEMYIWEMLIQDIIVAFNTHVFDAAENYRLRYFKKKYQMMMMMSIEAIVYSTSSATKKQTCRKLVNICIKRVPFSYNMSLCVSKFIHI